MVRDGIYYGIGFTITGALLWFLFNPYWALPCFLLAAFCMYFFRDPDRQIPEGPVAVSPGDGKVVQIRPLENGGSRVSVFLNIFDVHVNRIPLMESSREASIGGANSTWRISKTLPLKTNKIVSRSTPRVHK